MGEQTLPLAESCAPSTTHLQFAQLLDGFLPPLDGRVGLQLQVFQVSFQLFLGCSGQGTLLSLIFQFCLVLMELSKEEMGTAGPGRLSEVLSLPNQSSLSSQVCTATCKVGFFLIPRLQVRK